MSQITNAGRLTTHSHPTIIKAGYSRINSIDLLRGIVMIVMALDHVRDYFHYDAFFYSPTDLSRTTVPLFFTRFITHYCAPVFVFLSGISSYLYGIKRTKRQLSFFLLTRGIWLVLIELFVVSLFRTFNPTYPYLNLQVIWAIGLSMIALSFIIYMNRFLVLTTGILLIAAHNLFDTVHIQGNNFAAFFWSILHEVKYFRFGHFVVYVHYPVLPWIGVMAIGYYLGSLYSPGNSFNRKKILVSIGAGAIVLFIVLRFTNCYGEPSKWFVQRSVAFSVLSFLNVTKYPPSLLYLLVTLGPSLIFLAIAEKTMNAWLKKIVVFGRVPMFYYLAHILLIHILAVLASIITGYKSMIILNNSVNDMQGLKGYGFGLVPVYIIWAALILMLYPVCKWYDSYKRNHQAKYWWLSYL